MTGQNYIQNTITNYVNKGSNRHNGIKLYKTGLRSVKKWSVRSSKTWTLVED